MPVFLAAKFAQGTGRRDAVIFTVHRYQKFIQGKTPHPQQLPQPTTNCNVSFAIISMEKNMEKNFTCQSWYIFSI